MSSRSLSRTASVTDSIRESVPSSWRSFDMPAHLRHTDGSFTNARGQSLSYLALFPPAHVPLRAIVVYIHGLGEHARRSFHIYEQLCERGFGALAYDLVSHGESDSSRHRTRAHAEKFQYFVDDTNAFLAFAKESVLPELLAAAASSEGPALARSKSTDRSKDRATAPPLVVMGASFGTLITLHTLLSEQHRLSGVVLLSPAISIEWRPLLRIQALVIRPLAALAPTLRAVPAVKSELLCRDPAFLDDYANDPLTIPENMTLRMGAQSLKACVALQKEPRFRDPANAVCAVPVLFMMGSADRVTSVALATEFFERMRSRDKEFKVFDGMYHALFDDPEKDDVFAHLFQWLEARFPVVALGHADEKEVEQPSSDARAAVA